MRRNVSNHKEALILTLKLGICERVRQAAVIIYKGRQGIFFFMKIMVNRVTRWKMQQFRTVS